MTEMKVLINAAIGAKLDGTGITANGVAETLAAWNGVDDVCIEINSGGGSVWECVGIFNEIRDFARKNKGAKITTYIKGMAASSASIIALAAKSENANNKIICEDNSVYMIHNSSAWAWGDKREMLKQCDLLTQIDEMMAKTYAKSCGKGEKVCAKMMDDETWLFGQDIVANGFADEIIKTEENVKADAAAAIVNARAAVMSAKNALSKKCEKESFERIAAMYLPQAQKVPETQEIQSTDTEVKMTVEEIKTQFPTAYAEIFEAGKSAGASDERARCDAHLKMGEVAGCLDVSAGFIRDGSPVASNDVQTKYFERRCAAAQAAARDADEPEAINTPKDTADAKSVMMSAFEKSFR